MAESISANTDETDECSCSVDQNINLSPQVESAVDDLRYMMHHIVDSGMTCPPGIMAEVFDIFQEVQLWDFEYTQQFGQRLAKCHQDLTQIITPVALKVLRQGDYEIRAKRIVRRIYSATLVFLLLFFSLTSLEYINATQITESFLERSGIEQVSIALLYMSAAGIGACFYNLIIVYRHLMARKFSVTYETSYYTRILLGVVSGYVLAEVIPIDSGGFSKPVLAMLGGFSIDAVEIILDRFVEALKSLVKGTENKNHTQAHTEK